MINIYRKRLELLRSESNFGEADLAARLKKYGGAGSRRPDPYPIFSIPYFNAFRTGF